MMRKVKVVRSSYDLSYYSEEHLYHLHPVVADWEEVDDQRYNEIHEAIRLANSLPSTNGHYILIEYSANTMNEMFESASKFAEKVKKEQKRREDEAAARKAKAQATALERKRKQLEKLKRELEDQ